MKKKLLAALVLSLAMAAPQVNAEPTDLEKAWNNPTDPNYKMYWLPNNGTVTIQEGLNPRVDDAFQLNDFDDDPPSHYGSINGNGHSGFSMGNFGGLSATNAKDIYGFNTDGNGGAFNLTGDSYLEMDTWNHDGTTPLMTTIKNNTATGKGGGIYQQGSYGTGVYLMNVSVKNNHAGAEGGGMYVNYSVSRIDALAGSTVQFMDNTAVIGGEEVANDIYLYTKPQEWVRGTMQLLAEGSIEDPSATVPTGQGEIYIGDMRAASYYDVKVSSVKDDTAPGRVTIGRLWLDGTSSFDTSRVAKESQTEINIGLLDMKGSSVLNTVNNYIDNNLDIEYIYLDNSNNKFFVDADLANNKIDHFGSVSASSGTAKLNLNIISANTAGGSLKLFDAEDTNITITGGKTQYGENSYAYSQAADKRYINYTVERSTTLQEALQDYTAESYDMPDLYVADSNLGLLHHYYIDYQQEPPEVVYVDRTFTINGNNGVLMAGGADISGIEIPQQYDIHLDPAVYPTPKLNINNLEGFAGFTKRTSAYTVAEGGAILADKAILNVNNVTFANNMATGTKDAGIDTFGMGGAIYLATPDEYEKIWDEEQQAWVDGDHVKSVISNSTFVNNKTVAYGQHATIVDGGGAIYAKGDLDITNSLFNKNSAISNIREGIAEGGALYYTANSEGGVLNRDLNITNTMFMGNTAGDVLNDDELISTEGLGGAILLSRADANIVGSTFINNTAHAAEFYNGYTNVKGKAQGGAIYIDKWTTTAPYEINITDSTFAMNTAEAVKSEDNGDGTYTLTTEGANQSQAYGGAIAIMPPSGSTEKMTVNIDNTDFLANKSGNGGAIYNYGSTVNISNSSFNANTAKHYYVDSNPRWNQDMGGGAIYNDWGVMNLDNVTFAGNYAKQITYDGDNPIVSMVKNDIRNDKTLNFVGKASTLDGGIYGSGRTYFNLDEGELMNIGANTSIVQSTFEVNSGIVNIVNADNITARGGFTVGENGVLGIESGTMVIDNKYFKEIENSGVILNGGTLDVTGEDLYGSKVTNNATGMFMNSGTVKAAEITNDGVFSNSDTGSITGDITNSENAIFNNEGIIAGNIANAGIFAGILENNNILVNDGYVTANITNNEDGVVVNNSVILNGLTNAGSFANTIGSVLDATDEDATVTTIVNSGNMINAGTILATTFSNSGTFLNGVNPSNIEEVIPEASVVATTINNSGMTVNYGVLAGDKVKNNAGDLINNGTILGNLTNYSPNGMVENSGTIIGDVENFYSADSFINNGSITGDVVNNGDGFVNAGIITGNVENNGGLTEVEFENYGTIDGNLVNSGNMLSNGKITGDVDNSGTLASKLDDIGGTINMSWSTAELELLDNGITFNESNKSKIQGNKGTLSLYGDIISDAVLDYTGKINLNSGATVTKGENGDAFQSASKIILNNGATATLNTLNGVADALAYADGVIDTGADSTLRLEMDWNDTLTAGGSLVAGDVEIAKLDLSNVADGDKTTIITDTIGSKVAIKDIDLITTKGNANSVSYVYHAGTVTTPGYGELTATKIPNLVTVLDASDTAADENAYYNYAMSENEQGSTADNIIGNLKVSGQGNSIITTGLSIGDGTKTGNVILSDTNLKDITTMASGTGAVTLYDNSTLTIRANEHDVTLSGTNGANKNVIYMDTTAGNGATVTLEANNGHTITINDDICSSPVAINRVFFNSGNINMNGVLDPLTAINAGANITRGGVDESITWQLFGGNLKYLSDSYLNNPSALNSIEFYGGNLDLMNGAATTIALNDLQINATSNMYVDADLAAGTMDRFTSTSSSYGGGTLNVAGINLLSDAKADKTTINFTDDATLMGSVDYTGSTALSRVFKYNVGYDNTTGDFEFNRMATGSYKDYNPGVLAAPIAAQLGGLATQLNSYDQAFMNMDMYMMMPSSVRTALKMRNKIASLENARYDDTKSMYDYAAGWFRPYATFENVPLHNGPRVSNVMYGSFFGGESSLKDLGHGWDGMWGAYVGYNGSHQAYDGVGIYQNGGTLGLTGMAYKGNYFLGGTINVGAAGAEASTAFGQDDFAMLMSGAALKTGYNWELANGKFIIQPSLMAAYTFVNTFDYTNAAGVRMDSDPLNAITLEPGVKFIGNLKNGWQPYAGISMVFNVMDRANFHANDISLPNFSINPFVRYGVGVRKTWGERLTGHFQTYMTNGGRNGVGLSAGLRWAIGKDGSNDIKGQTPELRPVKITLKCME